MAGFQLPPRSQVGYLDPQIAGEGVAVNLDSGHDVNWTPPPIKPNIPDWSQIKSIQKYFNRANFPAFPAWIYHKDTDEKKLVTEDQAADLGVIYRDRTSDEASRFGSGKVWDYADDCPWRSSPNARHLRFDPDKPGTGKTVTAVGRAIEQGTARGLSTEQIGAAVAAAIKANKVDEGMSVEKMAAAFAMAFKSVGLGNMDKPEQASDGGGINEQGTSAEQERDIWIEEAESRGVKIDKRWSTERIKQAVAEAA